MVRKFDMISVDMGFVLSALLILMAILILTQRTRVEFHCEVKDIEYVKLEGAECYGKFSSNYCPLPKTIDCEGKLDYPNLWFKK